MPREPTITAACRHGGLYDTLDGGERCIYPDCIRPDCLSETTHGSAELDKDALKLLALGADPGPEFVIVACSVCGGDGSFDESGDRWRKCEACDGTGNVEVRLTTIEMEDLDRG